MGIFDRLGTVIKSNVNDLISKAEDPEKMLNQLIIDMNEQYKKAKVEVASAIADEKRLKRALDEQEAKAADWTKKAELAVSKGDDKLAIAALNRKKEIDELVAQYRVQWEGQKSATDKLKASLRDLSNKIEEAKRKKGLLVARTKRAEAQKSIQKTMSGLNDNSVFDTFSRMSEKVDAIESQAVAEAELNDFMDGDDLDDQFKELEQQDAGVMDELAALKAKLGK
ncbi:MAG: PspA/IM30 family protein [Maledivibacter sp.]|jgi:phage shock protein A|nr:PspA/IM30 family protein [Maledivibacter sp.]